VVGTSSYETFGEKDSLAPSVVVLAFAIAFARIKHAGTTSVESVLGLFGCTISEMSKLLSEQMGSRSASTHRLSQQNKQLHWTQPATSSN
jgi:hypothetical protein